MSDATPDPTDKAYAEAEAMLSDDAARAARRARVLAAVAQEPATAPPPRARRSAWRHSGWLAAASVAGLSVLVAIQMRAPVTAPAPPAPAVSPAAVSPSQTAAPPTPTMSAPVRPTAQSPRSRPSAPRAEPPPAAPSAPAPPPPVAMAPAPAPPPTNEVNEMVATGSRREAPPGGAQRASRAMAAEKASADTDNRIAKLLAAALAGRTGEVRSLLAAGVPVDAPDEAGETALMKSIEGKHPVVAELLRRHGADLDLRNHAGVSARDMAAAVGDPQLDKALDLDR